MGSWIPEGALAHKTIFTTENKQSIRTLKKAVHELSSRLPDASLCTSARTPQGFLITSASLKPAAISDEDFIEVHEISDGQLKSASGLKEPSADAPLHNSIYSKKPDIYAILHIHSLSLSPEHASRLHIPLADASGATESISSRGEVAIAGNGLVIASASVEDAMDRFLDIFHRKKHLK